MCLLAVGAELPIMTGARPHVVLQVCYDEQLAYEKDMKRDRLPGAPRLPSHLQRLLAMDRRRRGEHRPKRLVLGTINREPYHFYSLRLPAGGLHLPHGELCGHLSLVLWVELRDPMFPCPVLFHLKGSDPVIHPIGKRLLWKAHKHWTPTTLLGNPVPVQEETECGCGVRVMVRF